VSAIFVAARPPARLYDGAQKTSRSFAFNELPARRHRHEVTSPIRAVSVTWLSRRPANAGTGVAARPPGAGPLAYAPDPRRARDAPARVETCGHGCLSGAGSDRTRGPRAARAGRPPWKQSEENVQVPPGQAGVGGLHHRSRYRQEVTSPIRAVSLTVNRPRSTPLLRAPSNNALTTRAGRAKRRCSQQRTNASHGGINLSAAWSSPRRSPPERGPTTLSPSRLPTCTVGLGGNSHGNDDDDHHQRASPRRRRS
jgi:hypothetical protein